MKKNNTSMKLNSKDIISTRDNISKEKNKLWKIIIAENVMSKKAIAAGIGSGFDLNAAYNKITQLSDTLIKVKGMLQYINMGITEFDLESFKKTHYYTIFAACEKKELFAKLEELMKKNTINPVTKAKAGKKGTGLKETFSTAKITAMKKKIQLEINALQTKIDKFNDEATIDVTSCSDDLKPLISA